MMDLFILLVTLADLYTRLILLAAVHYCSMAYRHWWFLIPGAPAPIDD